MMGKSIAVLIVEDLESDAQFVLRQLRKADYDVVSERVEDTAQMRAALAQRTFDLVIADYSLPEFDAPSALQVLRETGQDIPFIVVSGSIGEDIAVAMLKAGANDYLMKSNLPRLVPAIEHALDQAKLRRASKQADERVRLQDVALNAAANAIVISDLNGTIEWVNPAFAALTGYTTEEAVGRNPRDLIKSGQHDQAFYKMMWDTILQGNVWRGEVINRKKDGSLYTEELTITPVRDETGAITHFIAIKLDVTERKRAEEALVIFRTLIDRSNDTIEVIEPETGRFLDVNERACLSSGYTREELLALRVSDLNESFADWSLWLKGLEEVRAVGSRVVEGVHRRKDGSTYPVEVSVRYIQLNRAYLVAVVRDITERKWAEQTLREAQERSRRAANAGNVGLWEWDLKTNTIQYSPECKLQIGYEEHEIGDDLNEWVERLHPEDRARVLQHAEDYIANRLTNYGQEFRLRHKDGSYRWILAQGSLLTDNHGIATRMVGSHVDVTERKRLEEQFLQAQKMESVGRLAGGVAHDFNNLLSVIIGYADFALDTLPRGSALREGMLQIRQAGDRAAALTRQLLAFSRRQVMQPEVLHLGWVIKNQKRMLQRLIGEDIELVLTVSRKLGSVRADPGQIEQIVMNLVVNARDAMPSGGNVTIELANADLDDSYSFKRSFVSSGAYVMLSVSDTGTGMDDVTMERVFEPFFTTKEIGRGTGLGLATVYGIVKQSGGHIFVYSEVGKGTTFKIYLPRVEGEAKPMQLASEATPASGGGETILVVEDEVSVRLLVQRILRGAGYTVLPAVNGAEALGLAEHHNGQIQLMLTDVIMPGINGKDLAEKLTKIKPELKVIYMSGYTDDMIVRHGVLDASTHFVSKPFTAAELARKVREVLDS